MKYKCVHVSCAVACCCHRCVGYLCFGSRVMQFFSFFCFYIFRSNHICLSVLCVCVLCWCVWRADRARVIFKERVNTVAYIKAEKVSTQTHMRTCSVTLRVLLVDPKYVGVGLTLRDLLFVI